MKKLLFAVMILTAGCTFSKDKEGEVVKDRSGNYYLLKGDKALGNERYLLVPIDTIKYKPF